MQNRGKQFENVIRKSFERVEGVSIDRLNDNTAGFKGVASICDFIVYHKPNIFYIECKSIHGNTFPLSNITDKQWKGLLEKSKIDGVIAGVIVWWVDRDVTRFFTIDHLNFLKESGYKGIGYAYDGGGIRIDGKKKRVFFDYDMSNFFSYMGAELC